MINFFVTALKWFAKTLVYFIERRGKEERRFIIGALIYAEDFTPRLYTKSGV